MSGIEDVDATIGVGAYLLRLRQKLMQSNQTAQDLQALQLGFLTAISKANSADAELLAVKQRIAQLEAEVAAFQDWAAEAEQYATTEVSAGIFVTVMNDNKQPFKNAVKLCCNCFSDRKKSILQYAKVEAGRMDSLVCSRCRAVLTFRGWKDGPPVPEHVPVIA